MIASVERRNNFDAIRLLAAGLVLYGHAFPLDGAVPPGILGNPVQTVGVKTFFVISGYLITQSWYRDPSLYRYFTRRALRILPGLFVVVAAAALLVGPIYTRLTLREYFSSPVTRDYFGNCALYIHYFLPGVFEHNTYPQAVNGSLWSLPAEVAMYLVVPPLWLLFHRLWRFRLGVLAITIALAAAGLYFARVAPIQPTPIVYGMSVTSFLEVSPYFMAGAVFYLFELRRFFDLQMALVVVTLAACATGGTVALEIVLLVALPYVVLSLALAAPARLHSAGRFGDLSYGVYLYGFPVQQMASATLGKLPPHVNFAICLPVVLAAAFASWHLVEKRALAWKPRARSEAPPEPVVSSEPRAIAK
jgi:peptidoglycan/LPS O-acetylase OafA/YrhL